MIAALPKKPTQPVQSILQEESADDAWSPADTSESHTSPTLTDPMGHVTIE